MRSQGKHATTTAAKASISANTKIGFRRFRVTLGEKQFDSHTNEKPTNITRRMTTKTVTEPMISMSQPEAKVYPKARIVSYARNITVHQSKLPVIQWPEAGKAVLQRRSVLRLIHKVNSSTGSPSSTKAIPWT